MRATCRYQGTAWVLAHRNVSAYAAACLKKQGVQSRAIIQPFTSLTQTLKQRYVYWSRENHACHMQLWLKPGRAHTWTLP